uniref:Transmembrane protein n=1 Tax=Noccaea caerulescens TaxID=107243 RepID=A0A1J3DDF0_NOCCA
MENLNGFMTVFAVSGSVVLLAAQLHKRLLSDYMDKLELQFRMKDEEKKKKRKKVSFADDVMDPSGNSEEYRRKNWKSKLEDGGRRISQKSQLL